MKICFALAGNASKASSRVRGYWISEELEALGHFCTLKPQENRRALIKLVFSILRHDVIVFQKTFGRYHHWLLLFAKLLGKRTYIDIDDAPSLSNAAHTMRRVAAMMRASNGVFAGSRNLEQYALEYHPNTNLVPSAIKLENYPPKDSKSNSHSNRVCLGWIGNGHYYADDIITLLVEPLTELAKRYPIKICIVGACKVEKLSTTFQKIPNLAVEIFDSINWSNSSIVASHIHQFDIGLYPLIENQFNHYKCGFKALEYMACGLPVVSSKVAINMEIVRHGMTGYLAENCSEWIQYLDTLIASENKRIEMGNSGRALVEKDYSIGPVAEIIDRIIYN